MYMDEESARHYSFFSYSCEGKGVKPETLWDGWRVSHATSIFTLEIHAVLMFIRGRVVGQCRRRGGRVEYIKDSFMGCVPPCRLVYCTMSCTAVKIGKTVSRVER